MGTIRGMVAMITAAREACIKVRLMLSAMKYMTGYTSERMKKRKKSSGFMRCSTPSIQDTIRSIMLEISNLRNTMVKGPSTSLTILNQTNVRLHMIMVLIRLK